MVYKLFILNEHKPHENEPVLVTGDIHLKVRLAEGPPWGPPRGLLLPEVAG